VQNVSSTANSARLRGPHRGDRMALRRLTLLVRRLPGRAGDPVTTAVTAAAERELAWPHAQTQLASPEAGAANRFSTLKDVVTAPHTYQTASYGVAAAAAAAAPQPSLPSSQQQPQQQQQQQQPSPHELHTYKVTVYTGNLRGAGTSAAAHVQLVGAHGQSVKALVGNSDAEGLGRGSRVTFEVLSPHIGPLRRVLVERGASSDSATGDGWYLEAVTVSSPDGEELLFPCYAWFGQSDCGDYAGAPPLLLLFVLLLRLLLLSLPLCVLCCCLSAAAVCVCVCVLACTPFIVYCCCVTLLHHHTLCSPRCVLRRRARAQPAATG
jgi:PLAT/LH2 domain